MSAHIIDGKAFAANLTDKIGCSTALLKERYRLVPGLTVVLVGDDPASQVYVRNKGRQARFAGINSNEIRLPATVTAADVHQVIAGLNVDPAVHGILVQLPLPRHLNANAIINLIAPDKDVDGLHPLNAGRLATGQSGLVPCTPKGCMMLLNDYHPDLTGKQALVLGRSNLMGKPMAQLLLAANCTVMIAHSKSVDLPALCRQADILIAAVGRAEMVRGAWIKPGATVLDVGTSRMGTTDPGKARLVGDVCFQEAVEVAGAITPVPGGIGPMTIACLLDNTLQAACRQAKITL